MSLSRDMVTSEALERDEQTEYRRRTDIFGVNLRTDAGWQQLIDAIQIMMKSFAVTID